MTIHQKALEILSFYSNRAKVQESDFVSILNNEQEIVKKLNVLYDTNVSIAFFNGCKNISTLLWLWESETTLDFNEQSDRIQERISRLDLPKLKPLQHKNMSKLSESTEGGFNTSGVILHQKALEVLSFYSNRAKVQDSDSVSILKNEAEIVKKLNILYDTDISFFYFNGCKNISTLLWLWEREANMNVQSDQIQKRINILGLPDIKLIKRESKSPQSDHTIDSKVSVVKINIVKPINVNSFIYHLFILIVLGALSQYGNDVTFFLLFICSIIQYVILSIRFDIPTNANDNSFQGFIDSLRKMQVPVEDLLVPCNELQLYYTKQRNCGYYILIVTFVIALGNVYPLFTLDEVGALIWGILFVAFNVLSHFFVLGKFVYEYFVSSSKIKAEIVKSEQQIKKLKQKAQAESYELSSHVVKESDTKQLYLLFDNKSRNNALHLAKELSIYLPEKVHIHISDVNEPFESREHSIENALVVLCLIDSNFVNSIETMQELVCASNLNKTIITGRYKNTVLPSNLSRYLRREIHQLEESGGYNALVLELLPLFGFSEPLADAVGDYYEIHIKSSKPFIVAFDDRIYNFTSSQILRLFFSKGNHRVQIYNDQKMIITRMVAADDCSIASKKSHFIDKIDLDSIIIGPKEVIK